MFNITKKERGKFVIRKKGATSMLTCCGAKLCKIKCHASIVIYYISINYSLTCVFRVFVNKTYFI